GSHFTVDSKTGDLKTENAALHAIKNFFSTGKALHQRNEALRAKMADILRKTDLPDLCSKFSIAVSSEGHGKHLLAETARQDIIKEIKEGLSVKDAVLAQVLTQVRALPKDCRDVAARLVMTTLKCQDFSGDKEAALKFAADMIRDIKADKDFQAYLKYGQFSEKLMREHKEVALQTAIPEFKDDLALMSEKEVFEDGVHYSFGADATRSMVTTINGQPCPHNHVDGPRMIAELLPYTPGIEPGPANPGWKLRCFVSRLASRSGIAQSFIGARWAMPEHGKLIDVGLSESLTGQTTSIKVAGGKAVIESVLPINFGGSIPSVNGTKYELGGLKGKSFAGYSYKVTIEVSLDQQLKEGDMPAFTARVERGPA
ncbi:MAG: hypothetical protein HUK26_09885, partial [Duodenibacillus sp.]|nr:hypothetical protein [Duodenibacillus sp.]